ncbi:MAG TPA: DUF488 domain-containing protein [Terriglobales bacterium]|nr:DUF488 domain-containing protein [Terriglobales bacterium]
MIYESYISKIKTIPKSERFLVNRNRGHTELSPSEKLIHRYKSGKLSWNRFRSRFLDELTDESWKNLNSLAERSHKEDICLICYERDFPCHRFILIELLMGLGAEVSV